MEWSFGILPLVRLFRKLKRVKDYRLYLYVPPNSALYYLVVLSKLENKVIQVYQFPWDTIVQNMTAGEHCVELDTKIIDILLSITFAEAANIGIEISRAIAQDTDDISFVFRVEEEILTIQSPTSLEIVEYVREVIDNVILLQDKTDGILIENLSTVLAVISQSPYDITKLGIIHDYFYFINDLVTRLLRAPNNASLEPHYIDNPFHMYCFMSGLFIENAHYLVEDNVIRVEYGAVKTSQICFAYFYPEITPIVEIPPYSSGFDNFIATHKVKLSTNYANSLRKLADEGSSDGTVKFLTFDRDTKMYIRDISWLCNYRRDIDLSYQAANSLCHFNVPPNVEALFTLYSQEGEE